MTEPVAGRKPVLALLMRLLWAAALALPAFGAQAGVVLTTLHSFQVFTNGASPRAGLVQGSDGSFYGTTSSSGMNGYGTVFKISANGTLTSLYSFTGGNDGANPYAGLVQGSDGYFYGTTFWGGTNDNGTVFKISTSGTLTSLHLFGGNDGANPGAGLVQGNDGYFYGMTYHGGTNGYGTVFKISANGTLTSLYSFTGGNDGADPSRLVQGSDGNFYGTTSDGGTNDIGTVFKISTNGVLTSLYSFTGGNDGANPYAGLVQGSDGYFYGTTFWGGTNESGTVFKISTSGALTTLYAFSGTDGSGPDAALVQGADGNFYGTTVGGGNNGSGTVFKISANGGLTTLYSFTGRNDGFGPNGLVQGSGGYFYGTTYGAGTDNSGTVFKISTNGVLTSLYSFTGTNDGANPQAGLVQGSDGNFYGTTYHGGTNNSGTVFKISANGTLTSLYSFTGGNDGFDPSALVQASDSNFYGTTGYGGAYTNQHGAGFGTVFKISTNGVLTTLYAFGSITNASGEALDGASPQSELMQASDGNFYGTTGGGGMYGGPFGGYGTVFKISTNGVLTTLYAFGSITNASGEALDGANPQAGLAQGSDGNFYGTTYHGGTNNSGTVFKISTNGVLTSLYSFTGTNDGANPQAGLAQGSDGNFYGTTYHGGTNNSGTVFKISTTGALITLYSFNGFDGAFPNGLVQGSDGNFYGTTWSGGLNSYFAIPGLILGPGTVFKISTSGALTSLYSFGTVVDEDGTALDGANPAAGLVQGSDGSFCGTTVNGGAGAAGTVFRLTIVPQPKLTIIPSGPYVILTWPTDYAGFSYAGYTLQSTTNLGSSGVWTTNSSPPVVIGGENVVINSMSGRQQFYRLSQ